MPRFPASTLPLLIGASALMFAGGLNGLILPVRGAIEGFSSFSLGLLGTGWAGGFILGCLIVPRFVRRVGHIRAFGAMTALAGVSILLSLLIMNVWIWIPLRALAGFCFAGAAQIVESWLNEGSDPASRGQVFGLYAMVNLASTTAGQMVLPLGDPATELFFVLGAVFYAIALIPTALYASHAPAPLSEARLDIRKLWANSPIAVVGITLVGVANSCFGTLAAVYGAQTNMSVTAIAIFVSVTLLAGAVAQIPVGATSDRFDRRVVVIALSLGAIMTSAYFIVMTPRDLWVVFAAGAVLGMFIHTMYPVLVSHANDHDVDGAFLQTSGGLLLMFGIGSIIGPVFGGIVMSASGPDGMFITLILSHLALACYGLWRMMRRSGVPTDMRHDFEPIPVARLSTQQTLALDPRADHSDEQGNNNGQPTS